MTRPDTRKYFNTPSRTQQHEADACDINKLMARYEKNGVITHLNNGNPSYGDFTNAEDYLSASLRVKDAEAAFSRLPAKIRSRMGNDPQYLLQFLAHPDNLQEAIDLGIVSGPPTLPVEETPTPPDESPEPDQEPS